MNYKKTFVQIKFLFVFTVLMIYNFLGLKLDSDISQIEIHW